MNGEADTFKYKLNAYALVLCDLDDLPTTPEYMQPDFPRTAFIDRISPNAPEKVISQKTIVGNTPVTYERF